MELTRHLRISGRVQGVGFRYSLRAEAKAHGLAGWVRNRRDGSVEALLQGKADAVAAVAAWARHGPPGAHVERLEEGAAPAEFDRPYAGFEQLPTL
jgi:acylphosphatase